MNEAIRIKLLSITMDFIHDNDYQDIDNFANKIVEVYYKLLQVHKKVTLDNFFKSIENIKTSFFSINIVSKSDFAKQLFSKLLQIDLPSEEKFPKFEIAKNFINSYLELGFDKSKFIDERKIIINAFGNNKNPHDKIIDAFEILLQKITQSFQVFLHGTKEYSGIDISKKIQNATIGFQIKSVNDDISEDKIRSQTSKAMEYSIDGFVWIYGCPLSKKVESSIQAAYHYFTKINENKIMYCALITPELLAELFRKYGINL
ncbi:MAG: hypothetical protein WED07_03265 [Candidatus Freyarchaeum deiterrae]